MHSRVAHFVVLLFSLSGIFNSGCANRTIQSDVVSLIQYDAKTDSFKCLQAYLNICTDKDEGFDHLKSFWDRRARIIINPVDIDFFSGITAYERLGKHEIRRVGFHSPGEEIKWYTPVDLDSIRVEPGEFCLNRQQHLCFYQQMVIPGKTVDAVLDQINPYVSLFTLEAGAYESCEQAKQALGLGQKRYTWDGFRTEIGTYGLTRVIENPVEPPLLDCISALRLIKAGITGSAKISRNGKSFTLVEPLSISDGKEMVGTFEFVRRSIQELARAGKDVGIPPWIFETLTAEKIEGGGIKLSVDMEKLLKIIHHNCPPPDGSFGFAAYDATTTAMVSREARINPLISIEDIMAKYAGK